MYNYYLDCIEIKVTENGQRCEGDSLRSLMTTYIPVLQRPELEYILNCPGKLYSQVCIEMSPLGQSGLLRQVTS